MFMLLFLFMEIYFNTFFSDKDHIPKVSIILKQQSPTTIWNSIFSDSSNELPDIDKLYSINQDGTTTCNNQGIEVPASQIFFTTNKIITRTSRGVQPKKSTAQLAFELQEQFDHVEKMAKKAQKDVANLKKQAKQLLPRKEKVSQLLEDFSELDNSTIGE